jgi:hypothetical protein
VTIVSSSTWWVKARRGGQNDTVVWMEDDWSERHQALGYAYRSARPSSGRVEIRRA